MDLVALADFDLVASNAGFGRAARASDRPKATLSRHVGALERALGVRLVDRGAHTLKLTEEGRALHARTHALLADLQEAGEIIASGSGVPKGRLRVSAPVVLATVVLARFAARFVQAHPLIDLEIVAEDRLADPVEDDYDLVLRINPRPDDRLFGRRVLGDELVLVATGQAPRRMRDACVRVPAVVLSRVQPGTRWAIRTPRQAPRVIEPDPVLRMSSFLMVREAVLTGAGAALLPRLLVADDLASGRLVLWGVEDGPPIEIWALMNSHRLIAAKVRAFLDAFGEAFPEKVVVRTERGTRAPPKSGGRTRRE